MVSKIHLAMVEREWLRSNSCLTPEKTILLQALDNQSIFLYIKNKRELVDGLYSPISNDADEEAVLYAEMVSGEACHSCFNKF